MDKPEAFPNLRVLDLCRGYPPAFSTMVLADFGAEVITINPLGYEKSTLPINPTDEEKQAYAAIDRNKKSICLNFSSDKGRSIVHELVRDADIFIENSRPGTMERLGIGYDELRNVNPRIIYCSLSGYGQDGPYRDVVGHDANFLAVSGALSLIGPKNGQPCLPSNLLADMAGSYLHSLIAILIALLAREKTGRGQYIDLSYTDCVFSLLTFEVTMFFLTKEPRRRGETIQTGSQPANNIYSTKDGKLITVAFFEPQFWKNLCQALGRDDMIFRQWPRTDEERDEVFEWLSRVFLTKTRDEWWEWAKAKEMMIAPILSLEEALEDQHLKHRQMVLSLPHPTLEEVTQVGNPFKLSDTPPRFKHFGPLPGQDTDRILLSLGYTEDHLKSLREERIIQ